MTDNLPAVQSAPNETTALIAMLERVATNPDVDPAKLEKLLDLQERVLNKQAESDYAQAMSAAQSEMKRVGADASNPQTRSKYASYAALDKTLRPIYTAHGFALSFNSGPSPTPEHVRVMCDVSHRGGCTKHFEIDMPADGKGAKGGDVMTKTHAMGAAMSYGMRYLLKMIFNVAVGEDDDDGNTPIARVSAEQAATLQALAEEVGADIPRFLKHFKAPSFEGFAAQAYTDAVAALEKKRKAA